METFTVQMNLERDQYDITDRGRTLTKLRRDTCSQYWMPNTRDIESSAT